MGEVECLMSLFTSTVMRHELLSSLQAWHPIMQIIRNGDTEAKDLDGYQQEDQYVILVA